MIFFLDRKCFERETDQMESIWLLLRIRGVLIYLNVVAPGFVMPMDMHTVKRRYNLACLMGHQEHVMFFKSRHLLMSK